MSTCADTVPTEKWAADNEGESSMNQFWYSAATLSCFVEEITEQGQASSCKCCWVGIPETGVGDSESLAYRLHRSSLPCPQRFVLTLVLLSWLNTASRLSVGWSAVLLEYDTRWDSVPQFQFFDYNGDVPPDVCSQQQCVLVCSVQ